MSAVFASNKIVKIISVVAVLAVIVIGIKAFRGNTPHGVKVSKMNEVPKLNTKLADDDTTAESVKTLAAEVDALKKTNEAKDKKIEALLNQKDSIKSSVSNQLSEQLRNELKQNNFNQNVKTQSDLETLKKQFENLKDKMKVATTARKGRQSSGAGGDSGIPIGLGYNNNQSNGAGGSVDYENQGHWLMPTDMPPEIKNGGFTKVSASQNPDNTGSNVNSPNNTKKNNQAIKPKSTPAYTIPTGGTLINGVAFTALLGRIPINGKVTDPYPFKILVGNENLAARGIHIPHLKGMIFGGIATGDWNLSCVRGDLTYATYVFDDGTISTFDSTSSSGGGAGAGAGGAANSKYIGYLSDSSGIPCVSGELKTNAAEFLTSEIGLAALQTAGQGLALANTTTQLNAAGGANISVNDVGKYTLGQLLAGGAGETRKWVEERQGQSFDAIFAPPGVSVVVNVLRQIPIDIDSKARRVSYGEVTNPYKTAGLD